MRHRPRRVVQAEHTCDQPTERGWEADVARVGVEGIPAAGPEPAQPDPEGPLHRAHGARYRQVEVVGPGSFNAKPKPAQRGRRAADLGGGCPEAATELVRSQEAVVARAARAVLLGHEALERRATRQRERDHELDLTTGIAAPRRRDVATNRDTVPRRTAVEAR